MYTSGWPKNQKRCCQRIGQPPPPGSKMCAPRWRSANNIAPALVSIGNAMSTSTLVTNMFQVKIGMRNIVMPGAHREHGGDDVHAGEHARQAGEHDGHDPEVGAVAGAAADLGQRRVRRPSEARGAVGREEAGEHREAAEQVEPVRQRVQPRERHVAGADVQRHEVVGQPERERPEEEEQHDAAVHREELVVRALRNQVAVRAVELHADDLGERAADEEEDERRHHVGRCRCACGRWT